MGKRGPLPKPSDKAQGHRSHELVVLDGGRNKIPPVPKNLTPAVRRAWRAYWTSEVSSVATEVSRPAIRRLFELYDQRERSMEMVRTALMVRGSVNQLRMNPAAEFVLRLEPAILRLENELGLTPMAMARLGIAVGEAKMTAEQLNKIAQAQQGKMSDPERDQAIDKAEAELRKKFLPAD
jgi:P27 family predicted phage terminase small subunit